MHSALSIVAVIAVFCKLYFHCRVSSCHQIRHPSTKLVQQNGVRPSTHHEPPSRTDHCCFFHPNPLVTAVTDSRDPSISCRQTRKPAQRNQDRPHRTLYSLQQHRCLENLPFLALHFIEDCVPAPTRSTALQISNTWYMEAPGDHTGAPMEIVWTSRFVLKVGAQKFLFLFDKQAKPGLETHQNCPDQ